MAKKLKKMASDVRAAGRYGDSELVHVSPAEKMLLDGMAGGRATRNPQTGMPEYFLGSLLAPIAVSAGVGALKSLVGGENPLKGAFQGAVMGGLTGGLGQAAGLGADFGLGSLFGGGDGAGNSLLGGLFGGGGGKQVIDAPVLGVSQAGDFENVLAGVASRAAKAAEDESMLGNFGKFGQFLGSPQGMIAGTAALSGLMQKDPMEEYRERRAQKEAEDRNYPKFQPRNPRPGYQAYAEGGEVRAGSNDLMDIYRDMYQQVVDNALGRTQAQQATERRIDPTQNLYANPFLFRGYQQDPKTQELTQLPASYLPFNTISRYNTPDTLPVLQDSYDQLLADITGVLQAQTAGQPQPAITQTSQNVLGAVNNPDGGAPIPITNLVNQQVAQNAINDTPPAPVTPPGSAGAPPAAPAPRFVVGGYANTGMKGSPDSFILLSDGTKAKFQGGTNYNIGQLMGLREDELQSVMGANPFSRPLSEDGGWGTFASGGSVYGAGGGKDDKIPAMLSDGEHVITADEVSMLGDGSNKEGQRRLYEMRKKIRKQKTGKTKQMPKARKPEAYLGMGA